MGGVGWIRKEGIDNSVAMSLYIYLFRWAKTAFILV